MTRPLDTRPIALMLFQLLAFLVTPGVAHAAGHQQLDPWVATWTASPEVAPSVLNLGLENQTIRMTVHVSVGGRAMRVRLSNVFGAGVLGIGEAHVAKLDTAGGIVPGSDRVLMFGGRKSVEVEPGSIVASDEVPLAVPALSDLAISLYVPRKSGTPTFHSLALSTSPIAAGNHTADPTMPAGTSQTDWLFLAGVDVLPLSANTSKATVVAFGDSITDGFRSSEGLNKRWPNDLAARFAGAGIDLGVVDAGISGNGLLHQLVGPPGIDRFKRDVLDQPGVKYAVVLIGTNDIGHAPDPGDFITAGQLIQGYKDLVARAHEQGVTVYGGTIPPFGQSGYNRPDTTDTPTERLRQQVNRLIRQGKVFDAVIDFDAVLRDPARPQDLDSHYRSRDFLHPNDAGYAAMANAVDLALFRPEHVVLDPMGMPPAALVGDQPAYSVWHDATTWHVRTSSKGRVVHFRGNLRLLGGRFEDVAPYTTTNAGPPQTDFIVGPEGHSINFDFGAQDVTKGIDFKIDGESASLSFVLEFGEADPFFDSSRVFVGSKGGHPESNPFTFVVSGDLARVSGDRALTAWQALQRAFAVLNRPGAYFEDASQTKPAFVWSQSQILHAAVDLAMIGKDPEAYVNVAKGLADFKLVDAYTAYAPTPQPHAGEPRFYDDNGWVALALLQASYVSNTPTQYVDMVKDMWSFFAHGQRLPEGGEYWKENDPKPVVGIPASGSDDEVAMRLHLATGPADRTSPYYTFASLNHSWIESTLYNPTTGIYYGGWFIHPSDNPTPPGNILKWTFTYDEGTMIGSDVLLYRLIGKPYYLDRATKIANAALDFFTPDQLWKQPAPFNAVFFRNLLALDHYAPNPRYRKVLRAYLDKAWNLARDPATGLFSKGGIGLINNVADLSVINQAAFVQMYTLLAMPDDEFPDVS